MPRAEGESERAHGMSRDGGAGLGTRNWGDRGQRAEGDCGSGGVGIGSGRGRGGPGAGCGPGRARGRARGCARGWAEGGDWAGRGRAGGRALSRVPASPRLTGGGGGGGGGGSRSRRESGPRCGTRVGIGARPGATGAGFEGPPGDRAAPPRQGWVGCAGSAGLRPQGPREARVCPQPGEVRGPSKGRAAVRHPGHAGSTLGIPSPALGAPRAGSGPKSGETRSPSIWSRGPENLWSLSGRLVGAREREVVGARLPTAPAARRPPTARPSPSRASGRVARPRTAGQETHPSRPGSSLVFST